MADERKRFYKGSGIAKHREWRGLKDTFYDYLQWAVNLGILVQFAAKSPVRIVKGLFEYRWFGGYIGALHMVDKCTAGLRGPALRTAHIHMHAIMKGTTGMLADSMIGDRRFGGTMLPINSSCSSRPCAPRSSRAFPSSRRCRLRSCRGFWEHIWIRTSPRFTWTSWKTSACLPTPAA